MTRGNMLTHHACLLFLLLIVEAAKAKFGSFWHITDLHLDPNYNLEYGDNDHLCWKIPNAKRPGGIPGKFGDRKCDSPKTLLLSALDAMKGIESSPDFIIWTGDDTTHATNAFFSEDIVVDVISQLTDMIREAFPQTVVLPTLGNHDYFPKNHMPPGTNYIIQRLADVWSVWFDFQAYQEFKKDGQYVYDIPNSVIRVLGLNTIPWFWINAATVHDPNATDPAGLFAHFEKSLQDARRDGKKVYITGHIPPGKNEKYRPNEVNEHRRQGAHQMQPRYNERFLQIVNQHHDVIAGQFFGHMHTDSFRVFLSPQTEEPISMAFSAPPVSPMKFGTVDTTHPAVRLIHYDTQTAQIEEIAVFYLDLEVANEKGIAEWQFEYNMTQLLDIQKIDPPSLLQAAHKIKNGDSPVFEGYYAANTAQWDKNYALCGAPCRMAHFCAIIRQDFDLYLNCRDKAP